MNYTILLASVIVTIVATTLVVVAVYEYDQPPFDTEDIVVLDPAPIAAEEPPNLKNDTEIEQSILQPKIIHSDYQILKQKYEKFLGDYNELVLINRNVIPYPINYGYVTAEGWTDTQKAKEWCGNLVDHTGEMKSLLDTLNESMAEGQALQNKTPQIIKLLDEKYAMLSELMTKETQRFESKINQFDCQEVISDVWYAAYVPNGVLPN